jgi:tripartite ATP-independent transporter DctM subunit
VLFYLIYIVLIAIFQPQRVPAIPKAERNLSAKQLFKKTFTALLPPLLLITLVLGAIFVGAATAYEAASVGAIGAIVLAAINRNLNMEILRDVMRSTVRISSMVFLIFIGAMLFTATFKGYGGDVIVERLLSDLPGGVFGAMFMIMLVMFLLGFILDFVEITLVVVPIVAPIIFKFGFDPQTGIQDPAHVVDPIWFGIMIAINLQTSFLTPPFGFSLFYLRGVAPPQVTTAHIYKGVIPFIAIQLFTLVVLAVWPELATWLASKV